MEQFWVALDTQHKGLGCNFPMNIYTNPISHLALWHGSECWAPADSRALHCIWTCSAKHYVRWAVGPRFLSLRCWLTFFFNGDYHVIGSEDWGSGEFPGIFWHCWQFMCWESRIASTTAFCGAEVELIVWRATQPSDSIWVYYCIFFIVFLEALFLFSKVKHLSQGSLLTFHILIPSGRC